MVVALIGTAWADTMDEQKILSAQIFIGGP